MKLIDALNFGTQRLKLYSNSPEMETMIMLEEITGKTKEEILSCNKYLKQENLFELKNCIKKRIDGTPLQYIVGETNFLGLDIKLTLDTFIPRQETEFMTYQIIGESKNIKKPLILEIGTGSGAIATGLAKNIKNSKVIATDISQKALKICKKNILDNNLEDKITLICGDEIEMLNECYQFDILVSNPPYIPEEEIENLPEIVKSEPIQALNGGEKGVEIINRILKNSDKLLKKNGILYIELGQTNIPFLEKKTGFKYTISEDQFGKKRYLRGEKL